MLREGASATSSLDGEEITEVVVVVVGTSSSPFHSSSHDVGSSEVVVVVVVVVVFVENGGDDEKFEDGWASGSTLPRAAKVLSFFLQDSSSAWITLNRIG